MKRILIDKIERDLQNLHYGLPWKYDATCFNFRPAKELVHVSEIDSIKKIIADSKVESVEGVVELLKKKARIIDEDPNPGRRILRQIEAVCIETESEKVTEQELEAANPYFAEIIVKKPAK